MDHSLQSTRSTPDESNASLLSVPEGEVKEAEPHIHLPNPSYWPILLSLAILVTVGGLLFISSTPWIALGAALFVLVCIIGWGLEDPMAPQKEQFVTIYQTVDPWKFKIGQNVVDKEGKWLGKIQARFPRYILVERGRFLPKVYYVPQSDTKEQIKDNTVFLTVSEDDLVRMGFNRIPADLYDEEPEVGAPMVRGAAQFARRPLSPAETGHYNYGRNWPGINTDASGSYHLEEIQPKPQTYVTEGMYATDKEIPPRVISPD